MYDGFLISFGLLFEGFQIHFRMQFPFERALEWTFRSHCHCWGVAIICHWRLACCRRCAPKQWRWRLNFLPFQGMCRHHRHSEGFHYHLRQRSCICFIQPLETIGSSVLWRRKQVRSRLRSYLSCRSRRHWNSHFLCSQSCCTSLTLGFGTISRYSAHTCYRLCWTRNSSFSIDH